jgi:hypothetical protein
MKQVKAYYKNFVALLFLALTQVAVFAQDSGSTSSSSSSTTTTVTTQETWYTQPWVWIVGGAVLLLLIVALVRGNSGSTGRSDKVTVTKTVKTDTDV